MARITVEDCLTKETNRFGLVQLASKRTKQLLRGAKVLTDQIKNKSVVTSLREIASGRVRFMTDDEIVKAREEEEARIEQLAVEAEQRAAEKSGENLFYKDGEKSPESDAIKDEDEGEADEEAPVAAETNGSTPQ
jgi:DNA-directed RNA polymerase subunit omega